MSNCLTLNVGDPSPSDITFYRDVDAWIMKIERTEKGSMIRFNTEDHPNCMPEDFARAVCEILCRSGYLDNIYCSNSSVYQANPPDWTHWMECPTLPKD